MIGEILTQHTWLWTLAWQSTTILALGIAISVLLRNRAVRAHQLLLLALVATLAIPGLTSLVKQHQWGLLEARPTAVRTERDAFVLLQPPAATESAPPIAAEAATASADTGPSLQIAQTASTINWPRIILSIWIGLSAVLLTRMAVRFGLGYRLARRSEPLEAQDIDAAIQRAKMKLGIRVDVHCRQNAAVHSPVIWCWGPRPVLLVPQTAAGDDTIDWPGVLCHELAHWKRRDHLSGFWAELIVCLMPWNPLVWVAQRRLVRLSEEACDDWVIASGQLGTHYARTLLGLTPQGHAALVPAVVSTRKGLATRVRRILTDRCGNPRSGLRWTLAATSLAACLALGIALAQAGPARSTGMIRTELPHGGVIEQLASTGLIEGTLRDPNGNPTRDHSTRIAMLPMTCYGVASENTGHFELPWSPSWIDAGQSLYLVARDDTRKLARIVEVEDPNAPVTIELEPTTAIKGKVIDPDGRPLDEAAAAISLPLQFPCRAPIAAAKVYKQGEFTIDVVPTGRAYTMEVSAEGYETKLIDVSVPSADEEPVILAPITLVPQGPTQTAIPVPMPTAESYETFQAVHSLRDGEAVKLVKPPFMRHRQHEILNETQKDTGGLLDYPYIVHQYFWDGQLEDGNWYANSSGHMRIQTVMDVFLAIPGYAYELSDELGNTHLARGDYLVRKSATTEEKIVALEEIIHAELHRPIHFEKRQVERNVIVVTGRYAFTPLPGKDPNRLYIAAEQDERTSNDEAESLSELLADLAYGIIIAIDDRTEPTNTGPILYSSGDAYFGPRLWRGGDPLDTEKTLPLLLDNLAKQTGLTFTVEKRLVDVWFATEDEEDELEG